MQIFKKLIICLLVVSFSLTTFAQIEEEETDIPQAGPKKQLATIIFSGIGGAILGLSTLSFYGRPQDHMENIAVGLAVGIISGTVFVTFKAATRPQEFYGLPPEEEGAGLMESSRNLAFVDGRNPTFHGVETPAMIGLGFRF